MLSSKINSYEILFECIFLYIIRTCPRKDYKLSAEYALNDFNAETSFWKINQSGAVKQQVYLDWVYNGFAIGVHYCDGH